MKLISILIATTFDRRSQFLKLKAELERQIKFYGLQSVMDVQSFEDNKEISIGMKRQKMLELCRSLWIVFFDSDDEPYDYYCKVIYDAIERNPDIDCIGMNVRMTTNGVNQQRCCHSLRYPEWKDNVDGWDYVRNITHFNPVKREKAILAGFKDIRYGEDVDYSNRLFPLLTKEFYIEQPLFHYKYSTATPHNEKYGIK